MYLYCKPAPAIQAIHIQAVDVLPQVHIWRCKVLCTAMRLSVCMLARLMVLSASITCLQTTGSVQDHEGLMQFTATAMQETSYEQGCRQSPKANLLLTCNKRTSSRTPPGKRTADAVGPNTHHLTVQSNHRGQSCPGTNLLWCLEGSWPISCWAAF